MKVFLIQKYNKELGITLSQSWVVFWNIAHCDQKVI